MKKDIEPKDSDGNKHGLCEYHYHGDNGGLSCRLNYVHGKKHGWWEDYHLNDNENLACKGSYVNDIPNGLWLYYYEDGITVYRKFYCL